MSVNVHIRIPKILSPLICNKKIVLCNLMYCKNETKQNNNHVLVINQNQINLFVSSFHCLALFEFLHFLFLSTDVNVIIKVLTYLCVYSSILYLNDHSFTKGPRKHAQEVMLHYLSSQGLAAQELVFTFLSLIAVNCFQCGNACHFFSSLVLAAK